MSLGGADSLHAFGVNVQNLSSIKVLAAPRMCRVICGIVFFWNASLTSIARFSSVAGSAPASNASATIFPQLMILKSDWQRGGGLKAGMGCLRSLTCAMTAHIVSQFAGGFSTSHALTSIASAGEAILQRPTIRMVARIQ